MKTKKRIEHADDPTLIESCREGEEEAWRILVGRYENLVYSTALSTGLDGEAAAEVHQRVWVELHRSLERLRNPRGLPKWLIVTARRLAYEQVIRGSGSVVELSDELVDPGPASDEVVEALELSQAVHRALATLADRCRRLVHMLFFEEPRPDYREVADRLGVAMGTLGSMRERCLARLRERMEESQ